MCSVLPGESVFNEPNNKNFGYVVEKKSRQKKIDVTCK